MSLDYFLPLTGFESLQEYALRHAHEHGLKVTSSTRRNFVLEPRRQRFFWKHQAKLLVRTAIDGYELEMRTRGLKYRDAKRVPIVFDDFFAGYAEQTRSASRPVSVPTVILPY